MTDSLEVEVLYPAWWRRRISEAQGLLPRGRVWRKRGAKPRPDGQKPDNEAYPAGRASKRSQSPRPSRTGVVNSAGVRWRRSVLPREVCAVSRQRDWARRKAIWPQRRSQQRA